MPVVPPYPLSLVITQFNRSRCQCGRFSVCARQAARGAGTSRNNEMNTAGGSGITDRDVKAASCGRRGQARRPLPEGRTRDD